MQLVAPTVTRMYETTVGFGGRLKLAVMDRGGLNAAVKRITDELGFLAPSRETYRALFRVESVEDLTDEQRFRALLLIAAIGLDPEPWLITPVRVPAALDLDRLVDLVRRQGLEPRTRWLRATSDSGMRSRALLNDCIAH